MPEELVTDRLLLRRWRPDDLEALADLFADRRVWEFPYGRGLTRAESEAALNRYLHRWEHDGLGLYALELQDDGPLIGYAGLQLATWFHEIREEVEVGWRLHPRFWGNGYATRGSAGQPRDRV